MYVCMYVCIHIYIYMCVCVCVCVCIHIYTSVWVFSCACVLTPCARVVRRLAFTQYCSYQYCMVYSIHPGGRKGSRILSNHRAILLHQGGQWRWAAGMKGWLSRAQQPRSKHLSCKGQSARRHYEGQYLSSYTHQLPGQLDQLSRYKLLKLNLHVSR